jgi:hypothetical protein
MRWAQLLRAGASDCGNRSLTHAQASHARVVAECCPRARAPSWGPWVEDKRVYAKHVYDGRSMVISSLSVSVRAITLWNSPA